MATNLPIDDVHYYAPDYPGITDYQYKQCRLDIYVPENAANCPVVIWFHGGGLSSGIKNRPELLKNQGWIIVSATYRLAPQAKCPDYIEDAAMAVAWTFQNIAKYGGDPKRIFVTGGSAGAYLSLLIGLDKRWLAKHNVDANQIAGIVSVSGQAITHFTIRGEKRIRDIQPVIDEFAPLFHVRQDAPPILLTTGGRETDLPGRYEENAYLARMLKVHGHRDVTLYELQGFDHAMADIAMPLLVNFVRKLAGSSQ